MRQRSDQLRWIFLVSVTAWLWAPGVTLAQGRVVVQGEPTPSINAQTFQPSASPAGIFMVEGAGSSAHLEVSGGLLLNYAAEPLSFSPEAQAAGGTQALVEDQLTADLLLALGLWGRAEVSLDLPLVAVNSAQVFATDLSGATLGDLGLRAKYTLLDARQDDPLGLGVFTHLILPTGDEGAFASDGVVAVRPGVQLDRRVLDRVTMALNVGAHLRQERAFSEATIGSELMAGLGAEVRVYEELLRVGAEVYGSTPLTDPLAENQSPLEILLGAKLRTALGVQLEVGGGGGLLGGYGSPSYRVFAGVRYVPTERVDPALMEQIDDLIGGFSYVPASHEWERLGPDADAALRTVAQRDDLPLTRRGRATSALSHFPTEDNRAFLLEVVGEPGAPVMVRRKAMLALAVAFGARRQASGACALAPSDQETLERVALQLNAPDARLREAAVLAVGSFRVARSRALLEARLPVEPAAVVKDEIERILGGLHFAQNGCLDRDQDGFDDEGDACPGEEEDRDGFEDDDGCPEPDNDNDGVLDAADRCADAVEDLDGFEDDDGCPEPDNDNDGVCDPWVAEAGEGAKYGCEGSDACPLTRGKLEDEGCHREIEVTTRRIELKGTILFRTMTSRIMPQSFTLLDDLTEIILGTPHVKLIEIQGHTDLACRPTLCDRLSQGRAEAVRQYLIDKGVEAERLKARGYGKRRPIAEGRVNPENRRVELHILEQEGVRVVEEPGSGGEGE